MIRRVTVRGVILHKGKMFCVKQKNEIGEINDYWCAPGGGLDIGEPIIAGLERELYEELGVKPVIGNLAIVMQCINKRGEERLDMFFHVKNSQDFLAVDLSKTTHGSHEISEFGFMDTKTANILPKVFTEIDFTNIIAGTKPPILLNEIPTNTTITAQT